jgi:hypothetical protein
LQDRKHGVAGVAQSGVLCWRLHADVHIPEVKRVRNPRY